MTTHQDMAIWEMLRQGLHHLARMAEQHWNQGEPVDADELRAAPPLVRTLIEQGNRQVENPVG